MQALLQSWHKIRMVVSMQISANDKGIVDAPKQQFSRRVSNYKQFLSQLVCATENEYISISIPSVLHKPFQVL